MMNKIGNDRTNLINRSCSDYRGFAPGQLQCCELQCLPVEIAYTIH